MTARTLVATVLALAVGSACAASPTPDPAATGRPATTQAAAASDSQQAVGAEKATTGASDAPARSTAGITSTAIAPGTTGPVEGPELRLLSYNIHAGKGRDGLVDLERVADLILAADPDVVALQEVDLGVRRTGEIDEVAELARLTGMESFFVEFMEYQGGSYGMAMLTRLPIIETKQVDLPWDVEPRATAVVTVETEAGPVTIAGIHFYKEAAQRLAQARTLDAALAGIDHPVVWMGDFNSRRDDDVMAWIETRFDVPVKTGDPNTFPSDVPIREIDFVIFSPADAFDVTIHEAIDEPMISDHRPVLAVLQGRTSPSPG